MGLTSAHSWARKFSGNIQSIVTLLRCVPTNSRAIARKVSSPGDLDDRVSVRLQGVIQGELVFLDVPHLATAVGLAHLLRQHNHFLRHLSRRDGAVLTAADRLLRQLGTLEASFCQN